MLTTHEADQLLMQHTRRLEAVREPLGSACGRVLREDVLLDRDYPPFDRATMDGIAVASNTLRSGRTSFPVLETRRAGEPVGALTDSDACIEIMTGAPVPEGCDTVIRYEDLVMANGTAALRNGVEVRSGQNIHRRGTDGRAGRMVIEAGTRLLPTHIATAASVGKPAVSVARVPRVSVICTGDELVDVDAPVRPHQIRQSNGYALRAALNLAGYGAVTVRSLKDDETLLRESISETLKGSDLLLITGGVSAGRFDIVPKLLAELDVQEVFHKIRQKPGKPMWFGADSAGRAVFGLPGNPVSSLVCLYRYVLPYLRRVEGEAPRRQPTVNLLRLPERKNDFTHFVPVRLEGAGAVPLPTNTSGDFLALLPSGGFAEVAPEMREPGTAPYHPWTTA